MKNKYSLKVADKFYNDENTVMITFCEEPFHFDGDSKTYYWHLECMYSHDKRTHKLLAYFLVYDEENETYLTKKGTNKALEINAKGVLSSADYDKVVAMMKKFVAENN